MKRRLVAITLLIAALIGGGASAAHAGKSCPKGSRYVSGLCVDNLTDDVVKDFTKHLKV